GGTRGLHGHLTRRRGGPWRAPRSRGRSTVRRRRAIATTDTQPRRRSPRSRARSNLPGSAGRDRVTTSPAPQNYAPRRRERGVVAREFFLRHSVLVLQRRIALGPCRRAR